MNDDQIVRAITDNQDFAVNMNNMLLAGRQYKCQASTRMAALLNTYGTNGLDHLLFDQRTQAQRQKVSAHHGVAIDNHPSSQPPILPTTQPSPPHQARKEALFRQARSTHAAKILPTNFDFRKK